MRTRTMTLGAALTVGLTAVLAGQALAQEKFEWSGRLEAGRTLEVRGISGDVVATLASGDEARVVATKTGRSSDFDEVSIEVLEEGNRVVVCAVYGSWNRGSSCDGNDDHEGGRDRNSNIQVSVDFEVWVPARTPFVGTTVSGDVKAEGLRADVEATTVSGSVSVSTAGVARGTTVSGDIEIDMGSLDWSRLDFRTVSGDITVGLPDGLNAEVEFESLSGDFDTDFDLRAERVEDRWVGSEVRGTVGSGGRHITFETVSGDVKLRRARGGAR